MYEKIFFEAWKEQFVIKTMYLDFDRGATGGGATERSPPPWFWQFPIQGEAPSIQASNFEDFNSCRQLFYSFSPQKVQKTMNLPYARPSPL